MWVKIISTKSLQEPYGKTGMDDIALDGSKKIVLGRELEWLSCFMSKISYSSNEPPKVAN